MLYQLHEFYRSMLNPWSEWCGIISKTMLNPNNHYAALLPSTERMAGFLQLIYRLGKDYEKPKWNIKTLNFDGQLVPVLPEPIIQKPFCNLLHFKRYSNDASTLNKLSAQKKILLCAPLSGHHATLLKDTVCSFLKDYDVYITDWLDARLASLEQGNFDLDDYVLYIKEFINHIGAENLHVISVCQPTVPVLAAVSLMASNKEVTPKTLVMMGGPIDARTSPTAVNSLAVQKSLNWFENNVIHIVPDSYPGSGRRVYPGFLQHAGFVAMNPDRHFSAHWDYYLNLLRGDKEDAQSHVAFYDEYNAVLDMTAEFYLQTIKVVFQDFSLPNGTWYVKGQLVKPSDINNCAILTIEGELDDISGSGQTKAAHALCTGIAPDNKEHFTVEKAGHYGIFSGGRWRNKVYPHIKDFLDKHDK